MAQWQKLNTVCQKNKQFNDKVWQIYTRFPIPFKIRSNFSDWIEDQNWSLDLSDEAGIRQAKYLMSELLSKIQDLEDTMQGIVPFDLDKVMDLQRAKVEIKKLQCETLVKAMKSCLQEEKMLLELSKENTDSPQNSSDSGNHSVSERLPEIKEKLQDMFKLIVQVESRVSVISQEQEKLISKIEEQNEQLASIEQKLNSVNMLVNISKTDLIRTKKAIELEQESMILDHFARRNVMADDLIKLAIRLAYLLQMIWAEIRKWQNEQKLVLVGLALPKINLNALDIMCEEGGQVLNRMILQVERAVIIYRRFPKQVSQNAGDDQMTNLEQLFKELLHDYLIKHLLSIFIVEQSVPNGILCVDAERSRRSYRIIVRILGGRAFGLGFSRPTVKMSLVNKVSGGHTAPSIEALGDCTFSVDTVSGHCKAEFQGVCIENVHPGCQDSLANRWKLEKFAFLFQTMVFVCGCEIPLQTLSHPLVVTSCSADDVYARGMLIWDAAFSESPRKPFVCRDAVLWSEFAQVLNKMFSINTGRGLDQLHLDYLARWLFNERTPSECIVKEKQVIWDCMIGKKFSFWTWCWANMALVRDIVNWEWKAGLIYGFISKEDARSKLLDSPEGTFLLRFSESEIEVYAGCSEDRSWNRKSDVYGHLTIAVTDYDSSRGLSKKLYYVKDYLTPKHIKDEGLSEILSSMAVADPTLGVGGKKPLLKHLWPDTERNFSSLFNSFNRGSNLQSSSDQAEDDDGYKRSKLTIEIFLNGRPMSSGVRDGIASSSSSSLISSLANDEDIEISCADPTPTPLHTLRLSTFGSRPTATVLPQPPPNAVRAVAPQAMRPMLPASQVIGPVWAPDNADNSAGYPPVNGHAVEQQVYSAIGTPAYVNDFAAFNVNGGSV